VETLSLEYDPALTHGAERHSEAPMVSRLARLVLGTLGGIVALAIVPGTAFPQADSERVRVDDKDRIAQEIVAAQSQGGPRSPALIQLLTELGVLYETEGQLMLATAALEQARQLVRANYGLHTLEQVPLMQQALANQRAIGNFAMIRALEEELLDLAERHPDDLRSSAIHREAGMRQANVLRRMLAGEAPEEVYTEEVYSFWRDDVIRQLVSDAQIHYADAAAVILRNGLYSSDELRDLEMEIIRTGDIVRQRSGPMRSRSTTIAAAPVTMQMQGNRFSNVSNNRLARDRDQNRAFYNPELDERTNALADLASRADLQGAPAAVQGADRAPGGDGRTSRYEIGRGSYTRLIAYDEAVFGDSSAVGPALISRLQPYLQLADWDLLYSQNGAALDQYVRVHELLKTTGAGEPLIAEIFAPKIPIVLPTFLPNPLETAESAEYIDVSFEITKFGESRRIEIVAAAPNVSGAAKDELVDVIRGARFRPRAADGELGRASPVVVRYYAN
jgi:hypothetical protein